MQTGQVSEDLSGPDPRTDGEVEMQCPQCNTENREGARFCDTCGAQLIPQPVDPGQEPAATLSVAAAALRRLAPKQYAERLLASRGQMSGERRVVTILMADVTGSSAMTRGMDPEEVMEIMDGAFEVLIGPIARYEGTVARLEGDAILAFFGAPIAHEDDPERAIRAALEITAEAAEYAERLKRERGIERFGVHVGIHTGWVVVGEVGTDLRMEYTAMGEAPNLAARLESAAEPGTVLISEATHQLIAPLFETQPLQPIQAKGWEHPVPVYRVLAAKDVPGKVRGIAGLESPLVGREMELRALHEALERLQAGVGGIVTIIGEAGIGKSRLVAESRAFCEAEARRVGAIPVGAIHAQSREVGEELPLPESRLQPTIRWVEGRCLSYGSSVAYLLWLDVLRGLLSVTAGESPASVSTALHGRVHDLCPEQSRDEVTLYLARLMSLPLAPEQEASPQHLGGEKLKTATFRAVENLIQCTASERPLVLVCEDLQWADPTSVELFEHILALIDRAPLLLIAVFRPRVDHGSWRLKETIGRLYRHRHTDLWLGPLSPGESQSLADNLLQLPGALQSFHDPVLRYAEGNPLYVEEIIRSLLTSGAIVRDEAGGGWRATQDLMEMSIPDTLYGVLVARIDRLEHDARRVLQMASVIGRSFLYQLLEAVAPEPCDLDAQLLTLQRQGMIRERARFPELEYIFKHELTREVAYNGLLKKESRALHRHVAEALERLFPERLERQLGLLAYHWEHAEVPQQATEYLQRAGDQARLAYANEEAIGYYQRALAMLERRKAEELPPEWKLEVAAQVCEGLGDVLDWTGRYDKARSAYQDALARAASADPIWRARLHRKTGDTCLRQRQYQEALQAYDAAQAELDADMAERTSEWWREWVQVRIERVYMHYWLAEWHEIGLLVHDLQPAVEEYGTPRQRCWFFSALALMGMRQDRYVISEGTLRHSTAAHEASQELGDLAVMANAQFELGFDQLWLGDLDKAEENLQASLTLAQRTGDVLVEARCLIYLAIACRKRGQVEQTRHYTSQSLAVATGAQLLEYIATAQANQAWAAWREENLAEAEEKGRAALELWQQTPLVYPFQWTALWPLIGVALAEDRTSDAVEHARALLDETQQRLPDQLTAQLEGAIISWQGSELERTHACLVQASEVAQQLGLL